MKFDINQIDTDREAIKQELARRSHLRYMEYMWQTVSEPFLTGIHTREICYYIDKAMQDLREGKSTFLVIPVPFRHGKALEVNTPISTPSGWKTMNELKVGDYVFSDSGKPVKVIAKSPVWHDRKLVKVDVDSGRDTIYCDENHLWKCKRDRRQKDFEVYNAKELCRHARSSRQVYLAKPLDLQEKKLPIAPYLLGVWLGDGDSAEEYITAADTADMEIERKYIESLGYTTYLLPSGHGTKYVVKGLKKVLKEQNLYKNKHIPMEYLRASYQQRFELLQGLIDTDGDVSKCRDRENKSKELTGGQVTFVNKNKQLAYDVLELVRSLGVKASITSFRTKLYGKDCGEGFKVCFYLKDCAKFSRKAERTRNCTKILHHALRFEQTDIIGDTVCIQVENEDGMFLCGKSFTPTHNSQLLSRYLPSHFLGEFPDKEVMLVTYASSLAEGFSRYARNLIRTKEYNKLYPDVTISHENGGVQQWGIEGHMGGCVASGLGSGLTGKGYHLGLLDDYCASRAEAESEVMRAGMWEHFTNDFLTRRAPVSITIVLATPWHTDDIIGRIKASIDPESDNYNPDFPPFKIVSFPAKDGEADIHVKDKKKYGDLKYHVEHVKYDYLFPERFTPEWYEQQFASLGTYASSALLQCNPTTRGGNMLKIDGVKVHESLSEFPNIRYMRVWDLAHSKKQREKDDPDWTRGTLLGVRTVKDSNGNVYDEIWIKDVVGCRENATVRDKLIDATLTKDGQGVAIGIENSLDAKDAVVILKNITRGRRVVKDITIREDKVARMSYVEPIFDAGNVHILRADWNLDWFNEAREFPSGKHDDMMDNISAGYQLCKQQQSVLVGAVTGV